MAGDGIAVTHFGNLCRDGALDRDAPLSRHSRSTAGNFVHRLGLDSHHTRHGALGPQNSNGFSQRRFVIHAAVIQEFLYLTTGKTAETTTGIPAYSFSMQSMGDRVRARRLELKLSQTALGDKGGVKYQTIQDLEKNKSSGSKHILAIAKALKVRPEWLETGKGQKLAAEVTGEAMIVGEIGAGDRVFRIEEGVVVEGGVEPPAGYATALAARIRGNSMRPLEPGWLVFYEAEHRGDPLTHVNKLCAVGLEDGTTYIKKLTRKGGKFVLKSWNADDIVDAKVIWASPVIEIRIR